VQRIEVKVLLKVVCYTCGLKILKKKILLFSYMHFVLICTVVVLCCFVVCVCACGFISGFCNVWVCEGFVICGCLQ